MNWKSPYTCAHFCYQILHCGKWDWCIVEFVQQVYYPSSLFLSVYGNCLNAVERRAPLWQVAPVKYEYCFADMSFTFKSDFTTSMLTSCQIPCHIAIRLTNKGIYIVWMYMVRPLCVVYCLKWLGHSITHAAVSCIKEFGIIASRRNSVYNCILCILHIFASICVCQDINTQKSYFVNLYQSYME